MRKVLLMLLLGAFSLMSSAQFVSYKLGHITVGNPYHGCISTLCYNESIYRYVILGKGNHGTWGFDLGDTPIHAIAKLQGIVDSYKGADTIWIDGYTIECERDKGFYVAEPAPGKSLPEGTEFWFSIANMKKDIKYLRRIENGKLNRRERRALDKTFSAIAQDVNQKVKRPLFVEAENDTLLFDVMAMDTYDSLNFDLELVQDKKWYVSIKQPTIYGEMFTEENALQTIYDQKIVAKRDGYEDSDTLYGWRILLLGNEEIMLNNEGTSLKIFGKGYGEDITVSTPDNKFISKTDVKDGVTEIPIPKGLEYIGLDIKRPDDIHYIFNYPVR